MSSDRDTNPPAGLSMTIHHTRIREFAKTYRVEHHLDPERNVLLSAEPHDLIDGDRLNRVFDSLEARLRDGGADDRTIRAVTNIVLELAANEVIHRDAHDADSDLLVVSRDEAAVKVWMFGHGRASKVERLSRVIKSIAAIAKPPDHREAILKRRKESVMRRAWLPDSKKFGGASGMMTIAALSSEPLWFVLNRSDGRASFALRSTV